MAISGHNYNDYTTVLCAFILVMNGKKYTFDKVFKILKINTNLIQIILCVILEFHKLRLYKIIFQDAIYTVAFFILARHYRSTLWNMVEAGKIYI